MTSQKLGASAIRDGGYIVSQTKFSQVPRRLAFLFVSMNNLNGMLSEMNLSANQIQFNREDHYHRTPGDFKDSEISVQRASRLRDEERGLFGPTQLPVIRWRPDGINPRTRLSHPDVLGARGRDGPIILTVVSRVLSTSFEDRAGRPLPHISSRFHPLYFADALAMQQMLADASFLPDGYRPFRTIKAAFRADRNLASDTEGMTVKFLPFNSVFDGRAGYAAPHDSGDIVTPQIGVNEIQAEDLAVYAVSIQRFLIPQGASPTRWTARLRLEGITLLQRSSETSSPSIPAGNPVN
ncbi:hypothetical protein BV25DRAFT_1922753 [Artomyces pyxidatus]|uniref:Uncharacterized protein n=1 Tax=Artomyces pyxidatus TaxID=48021 RepID=A0ACB8SDQ3_9AGAM|nr:hypothetical protein BV25DRAFT_1922753 [Artomyces pyxidatus]